MKIDIKLAKILTFAGAALAITGAIVGQVQRADCDQPSTWGWGLIHSLSVMNNQLREQACINESLQSPSTFILVIGLIALAVGVTYWLRLSGKTFGRNKKCPFCAEVVLRDAKICKHCGKDISVAAASSSE